MKAKKKIVVEVYVDEFHRISSRIRTEPMEINREGETNNLVFDREDKRGPITATAVVHRARMLAQITGLPYVENVDKPCLIAEKLSSHCCCGRHQ